MTSMSSLAEWRTQPIIPSLSGALRAAGFTCIGAALVSTFAFQSYNPSGTLWPAMVALLPMLLLLWLDDRAQSSLVSSLFLVCGAIAVFIFITDFYDQVRQSWVSDAFTPALVKVPLVMVGGAGVRLVSRLSWCLGGYVVAEIAAYAATVAARQHPFFDLSTLLVFVVIVIFVIGADIARRKALKLQAMLFIAAQDDELAAMKHHIEIQAAALLHDTVLSHLAAIANSAPGTSTDAIRPVIERDIETLVRRRWLGNSADAGNASSESAGSASAGSESAGRGDAAAKSGWQQSAVFAAIRESEQLGLRVQASGDLAAIARLSPEQVLALGLAVKQCLINVLHHSGTDNAEVAVDAMPTEVSVMIVDAGRGFIEKDTGADRLGLRHSVRNRMELVGGTVQVWSTPGRGTSVVIRIPVTAEPAIKPEPVIKPEPFMKTVSS